MKKLLSLCLSLTFLLGMAAMQPAQAATVVNFPNGCTCYALNNGVNPAGDEQSFLALQSCPGAGGWMYSYTQPETNGGIGNFPAGNVIISLPPPPTGVHRTLVCGNPPGTTPLVDYGSGTVYASYKDVVCTNGMSSPPVPLASQPSWATNFMIPGNGTAYMGFPRCNP